MKIIICEGEWHGGAPYILWDQSEAFVSDEHVVDVSLDAIERWKRAEAEYTAMLEELKALIRTSYTQV